MTEPTRIEITADTSFAREALARVAAITGRLGPTYRAIGSYLVSSTQRRFETKVDPRGRTWTPLGLRTIKERIRLGSEPDDILVREGDLRRTIVSSADDAHVEVGSPLVYAGIHQLGGTITAQHKARTGKIYRKWTESTNSLTGETRRTWAEGSDGLSNRFVSKRRANFEQDVAIGAYESTTTIPARPFLGLDDLDRTEIGAIVADRLAAAIGGRR